MCGACVFAKIINFLYSINAKHHIVDFFVFVMSEKEHWVSIRVWMCNQMNMVLTSKTGRVVTRKRMMSTESKEIAGDLPPVIYAMIITIYYIASGIYCSCVN